MVLNWGSKIVPLIRELAAANKSKGGTAIVILSDKPKSDMEAALQQENIDMHGSHVVCRCGSTTMVDDLRQVTPGAARAVIILSRMDLSPDDRDSRSLRSVLSLLQAIGPAATPHFIVELCHMESAHLIELVAPVRVFVNLDFCPARMWLLGGSVVTYMNPPPLASPGSC